MKNTVKSHADKPMQFLRWGMWLTMDEIIAIQRLTQETR